MAQLLHLFDKDILDDEGEPFVYMAKSTHEFFERIVGLLPMQISFLNNEQLVRTLEVLVRRELGSERLFLHYIFLKIERNVLKFNVDQFCRCVRAIADKGFADDSAFWNDYMFKFVYEVNRPSGWAREFSPEEAKRVWDTLIYLKLRCP